MDLPQAYEALCERESLERDPHQLAAVIEMDAFARHATRKSLLRQRPDGASASGAPSAGAKRCSRTSCIRNWRCQSDEAAGGGPGRLPFNEDMCDVVEKNQPHIVSFHFGLPPEPLLYRVKMAGCTVLASATTVDEARWLEANGCDAIIARGAEAGGHRGTFLSEPISSVASQPGTMALVPQVADAVSAPVIAAGGIADGRGIAAAFALGTAGVQVGTSYLHTPEAIISDLHREALAQASAHDTALTNLFSGRPARGLMNRVMREQAPAQRRRPGVSARRRAPRATQTCRRGTRQGRLDVPVVGAGSAALSLLERRGPDTACRGRSPFLHGIDAW